MASAVGAAVARELLTGQLLLGNCTGFSSEMGHFRPDEMVVWAAQSQKDRLHREPRVRAQDPSVLSVGESMSNGAHR